MASPTKGTLRRVRFLRSLASSTETHCFKHVCRAGWRACLARGPVLVEAGRASCHAALVVHQRVLRRPNGAGRALAGARAGGAHGIAAVAYLGGVGVCSDGAGSDAHALVEEVLQTTSSGSHGACVAAKAANRALQSKH